MIKKQTIHEDFSRSLFEIKVFLSDKKGMFWGRSLLWRFWFWGKLQLRITSHGKHCTSGILFLFFFIQPHRTSDTETFRREEEITDTDMIYFSHNSDNQNVKEEQSQGKKPSATNKTAARVREIWRMKMFRRIKWWNEENWQCVWSAEGGTPAFVTQMHCRGKCHCFWSNFPIKYIREERLNYHLGVKFTPLWQNTRVRQYEGSRG